LYFVLAHTSRPLLLLPSHQVKWKIKQTDATRLSRSAAVDDRTTSDTRCNRRNRVVDFRPASSNTVAATEQLRVH
jgi:hypothetical protein